jgi:hypothetical protein
MSVVPEKKSISWYAPAAVAVFGLGLYIARKKKIQLRFTDDSSTYKEVDESLLLRDATVSASTNLDISGISNEDLDALKIWWVTMGKRVANEETTTLSQNALRIFLNLKKEQPQSSIEQLLIQLETRMGFEQ